MDKLEELYQFAENEGIDVDHLSMSHVQSLSAPVGDRCCIAINPWLITSAADERCKLAHELGHCEKGAFYNRHSPYDLVQRHESRADKWAIKKLIPEDELNKAVSDGHTEIYDLAEYFAVTEDFMRKAVCWYQHGNLATEIYFEG